MRTCWMLGLARPLLAPLTAADMPGLADQALLMARRGMAWRGWQCVLLTREGRALLSACGADEGLSGAPRQDLVRGETPRG